MIIMYTEIGSKSVVLARDLEGGFVVSVDTEGGTLLYAYASRQDALQTYLNAVSSILFDGALSIDVRAA